MNAPDKLNRSKIHAVAIKMFIRGKFRGYNNLNKSEPALPYWIVKLDKKVEKNTRDCIISLLVFWKGCL